MYIYDYGVCSMAIFLTHNVNLQLNGGIGQLTELWRYLYTLLLFDYNGIQKIKRCGVGELVSWTRSLRINTNPCF